MYFMNEGDIEEAAERHAAHPVLGPAARTLSGLRDWADSNSDGWHMWPKPVKAAAQLMRLIEGEDPRDRYGERTDATPARLRQAYTPLKAFRTRMMAQGMPSFTIYEKENGHEHQ